MALPTFPQAVADYIAGLTDEDFVNGGHRTNFIPTAQGGMTLADYVRLAAIEMLALAEQVEDDAASAAAGSGTEVTKEQIWAGAAAQYLSIRRVMEAATPVAISFASTLTIDFNAGTNFKISNLTADFQLAAPTNRTVGKSGFIRLQQDATGGRVMTRASVWKFAGDTDQIALASNAVSLISYVVTDANEILATIAEDFA